MHKRQKQKTKKKTAFFNLESLRWVITKDTRGIRSKHDTIY